MDVKCKWCWTFYTLTILLFSKQFQYILILGQHSNKAYESKKQIRLTFWYLGEITLEIDVYLHI